jgi:hypothetical protein
MSDGHCTKLAKSSHNINKLIRLQSLCVTCTRTRESNELAAWQSRLDVSDNPFDVRRGPVDNTNKLARRIQVSLCTVAREIVYIR